MCLPAPKARAEGSQEASAETAPPLDPVENNQSPNGASENRRAPDMFCRPFRARLVYSSLPGAACSASLRTCPWLPSLRTFGALLTSYHATDERHSERHPCRVTDFRQSPNSLPQSERHLVCAGFRDGPTRDRGPPSSAPVP